MQRLIFKIQIGDFLESDADSAAESAVTSIEAVETTSIEAVEASIEAVKATIRSTIAIAWSVEATATIEAASAKAAIEADAIKAATTVATAIITTAARTLSLSFTGTDCHHADCCCKQDCKSNHIYSSIFEYVESHTIVGKTCSGFQICMRGKFVS